MNVNKAPDLDGLNAEFYKHHWEYIKEAVINYVMLFFTTSYLDPEINHTHISLVPKVESHNHVKDYMSISLCNVTYKLIFKILADMLRFCYVS